MDVRPDGRIASRARLAISTLRSALRAGGQARGGGASGAIVRSLTVRINSGNSAAAESVVADVAVPDGAETATVHEPIAPQDPFAHGARQEPSIPQPWGIPGLPVVCGMLETIPAARLTCAGATIA